MRRLILAASLFLLPACPMQPAQSVPPSQEAYAGTERTDPPPQQRSGDPAHLLAPDVDASPEGSPAPDAGPPARP